MSDKSNYNTDLTNAIENLKDNDSKEAQEALGAIKTTSQMINAIMAGKQLDLAYYSLFANNSAKRLRKLHKKKKS